MDAFGQPARAPIPTRYDDPAFVAVPLAEPLAALDHAAYVASPDVIREHSDGRWPTEGFTLADDRALIAKHDSEHRAGRAYTFLLLEPGLTAAVGCLYLSPLAAYLARIEASGALLSRYDRTAVMLTFWIRQDLRGSDLAYRVVDGVRTWTETAWGFGERLFRVLPAERDSVAALERARLAPVALELPAEQRPYLWYACRQRTGDGTTP